MPPVEAKRTLVKSPPELWAELSDAAALARHLGEFGEIRITRTQPESVVEWEGDLASGSVQIEPSGWGTKVTLTAEPALTEPEPIPEPEPEPEPVAIEPPRHGFWARLFRRRPPEPEPETVAVTVAPDPIPPPQPEPRIPGKKAEAALTDVLDALGQAHHRPFSRP
jgi:hypothetical protein